MSMNVGHKPYTGAINTNSERYKRAKALYDEGHPNGEATKSALEVKAERDLQTLKMLKQMLGQKYDDLDIKFKNPLKADEETFIRNYMGLFDEDGDFVNCYGIAGMDITGKDPSEFHKIIDVPEAARQDMFEETMRHFIQENGVGNGDTTKRSEVYTRYQLSVDKSERLSGSWTLEQYERMYTQAFYEAVKKSNPNWQLGQSFDTNVVRQITREDVENRIVKGSSEFELKPLPSLNIKV